MGVLTLDEILEATGGRVINGNSGSHSFTGVSIDSRTIKEGELFIALKGLNFDGHDFLMDAMEKGSGAIVSTPSAVPFKGRTVVHVKNTLKALQNVAHYVRVRSGVTVVGVTGTNGKTTTKELIAYILGMRHNVVKNSGNLNNHIGLPLSLTKIGDGNAYAVMEMGASMVGDIRQLCEIALPDYGVITNVGPAHLEGFGNINNVLNTKLELFDAVKTAALNADDALLMKGVDARIQHAESGTRKHVVTFGILSDADVYATDITHEDRGSVFTLCLRGGQYTSVVMNVGGRFNIYNALAAASICHALGLGLEEIKAGIESFQGVPMRLEVKELLGVTVISDLYNANPVSMEEAVRELVRLRKSRSIAVLGDMLELGAYAEEAHVTLGRWMSGLRIDVFIAVGPMMAKAAEELVSARGGAQALEENDGARIFVVSDPLEAGRILLKIYREGDVVLVKGSRGMRMERVLEKAGEVLDAR